MSDPVLNELIRIRAQSQRANGYQARQEIERIVAPLRGDPRRLEPHGFKVYSQNDEDGIIEEIFRRLGVSLGTFVEIGVESGLECNSLYLLHRGWRGTWIEGDLGRRTAIEDKFAPILGRRLQVGFTWITAETVNNCFKGLRVPDELDFLSIDIDGNDIYVIEALELRPKVICVEYNAKFPPHLSKRPVYDPARTWSGGDYMGSSLRALAEAAEAKGYQLVATNITGANAFFVRGDLAGDLFPADPSPANLYNPPRYWLWSDHFLHVGHRADFGPYVDMLAD
ncbi:MAG: hypothetical protein JHD15_13570 [Phenylobacterium sp.]|uniref:hypothetical protein n=1 Tax=Phenylobacterium sp. TaxID=1871053 RepID=UPI001A338B3A|nr:hypothetical protein [Phenylobacterium sp.]MBJ7411379.1 hypothetical protein [Phenylobacterium sp.]